MLTKNKPFAHAFAIVGLVALSACGSGAVAVAGRSPSTRSISAPSSPGVMSPAAATSTRSRASTRCASTA